MDQLRGRVGRRETPEPSDVGDETCSGTSPVDPVARPGETRQSRRTTERAVLLVVGLGGAVGALARYGVSRLFPVPAGHFPFGTLWINLSGSAALGLVLVLVTERFPRGRLARPLLATGFLGAYTTFSTYMVDADLLVRGGHLATAAVYALVSLVGGLLAVGLGMSAARGMVRLDRILAERSS